jgi:holo-[acyl-carrier protein] synthase
MMQVIGHGVDLVDVVRIEQLIARHGDHFLERVFSPAERAYCERSVRRRAEHLAVRFAAKEAVLKALGTGWRHGIGWTDIEVTRQPSGQPGVQVRGRVADVAEQLGVRQWLVSLSHTGEQALASVIAIGV